MTSKLKCPFDPIEFPNIDSTCVELKYPEHKHSYLVVYNAQYEKEQLLGNIEITTNMPLAYADLNETRQIIANKIGFDEANVIILNIIPMRVEHKEI